MPSLHDLARGTALQLGAIKEEPFRDDWIAFKIQGKWFALLGTLNGARILNLKVDPFEGELLREQYPGITPGYHMNKRHWITITEGRGVPGTLVRELVVDSFRLVRK
ncbi:MmcQ/YjbR family DNA-binding protein [Corynebacterium sp. H130]|uniref:MmcQ/YjbR family DNA-binding protein n=1 Tax=Corynebacterium sp. H130 TaxID=3133444 RepID=UPI003097E389